MLFAQSSDPCAEVYRALLAQGVPEWRARLLTAIAWAESGCRREATRRCPPDCIPGQAPEYSVGPWQINLRVHPISEECARDPLCAASYVLRLPLEAWTTYRTGGYQQSPWLGGGLEVPPELRLPTAEARVSPETKRAVIVATSIVLLALAGSVLLRSRR